MVKLTETWLSAEISNEAIKPVGFSVHRADRTKDLFGKSKGGGVCFMINNAWCDQRNVQSFCSTDLGYLIIPCRLLWLPREILELTVTTMYIPPQVDTDLAFRKLFDAVNKQETVSPKAASIVVVDFNKANFREVAPKYFQHISCSTQRSCTLDHCYSSFLEAYKALPQPPFGKSDHLSILLLPTYRQKLKRAQPTIREVHRWSDQSDSALQDCFDDTDWDIDEYADSVTRFIKKCIEGVVPTKQFRSRG
ncbi:hypothetical protein MHYP_G00235280 [Metynnis hypsauchen]